MIIRFRINLKTKKFIKDKYNYLRRKINLKRFKKWKKITNKLIKRKISGYWSRSWSWGIKICKN